MCETAVLQDGKTRDEKTRFTENQVMYALKQVEEGEPVADTCQQLGVSPEMFYQWRWKCHGLGVAEFWRLT